MSRALILCSALALLSTAAHAESGFAVRPSVGFAIDAWPFGYAMTAGISLERGPLIVGAHVRGGLVGPEFVPSLGHNYTAFYGAYGAHVGITLPLAIVRPYLLLGYELLGTVLSENTGENPFLIGPFGPNGRTRQDVTVEAGVRFTMPTNVALLFGLRGSFAAIDPSGIGPPLPRGAAGVTLLF